MGGGEQVKSAKVHVLDLHRKKPVYGHGEIDPTEEMLIDFIAETKAPKDKGADNHAPMP